MTLEYREMEIQPWVFYVQAYPQESFGHFLGRFRRANYLSSKTLAEHLGIRYEWVAAWEVPSRRRNPTELQLIALSKLVGIDPKQLQQMLPPQQLHLATRLCPACYLEAPVHLVAWQQTGVDICDRHQMPLLSACPVCGTGFRTPAVD
ncbi:hypothetical protein BLD44_027705 [Mastigocladus laminosus UU774]|nr:hypothetical protein BLD44_027705 [Mastigocladus laminosus UU774]